MGRADARRLTAELDRRARAEGFDLFGVAPAGGLERDGATLREWLARGRHAGMTWLAREPEKRSDPRRILADCRSVVMLAMNYYPGETPRETARRRGRVARYAAGRDYHRVIGGKLKRLAAWLEQTSGQPTRTFVDTGPVLERGWAERAGLGWIGKNSCLLNRRLGSWLLLGEILAVAGLEPTTAPVTDHCGSCTACIDACPTDAIVGEGVVDSNACISYWTIEHRGAVPEARRAGNDDWIFGCDVCQEVCPWNHKSAAAVDAGRFERRDDLRRLDPVELLEMDEAAFRRRFSGTALMRAKWQGMRRNACIVLGNVGDVAALPALDRALGDEDPVVRSHAAWAVRRIEASRRGAGR